MTDKTETPHLPQLDHDSDGKPGGSRKPPRTPPAADDLVWVVTRAKGLHRVAADAVSEAVSAPGGRTATDRDLRIAGVEA
jgi:hypothetical protein